MLAEILAYPYGQRNDTLSEQVIGSLDTKSREASTTASGALTKSSAAETKADEAETKSKEAFTRAKAAEHSLAKAESDAAKAQALATNSLTLARSAEAHLKDALDHAEKAEREIARLKTPRSLSDEQQKRIASKIKPFAGTPFDLWVNTDSDSTALMGVIDAMLRSAGWRFELTGEPITYSNTAGMIASSGISIHVAEEHRSELEPALLALANALTSEGLPVAAIADTANGEKGKKRDRIHVIIGSKPLN